MAKYVFYGGHFEDMKCKYLRKGKHYFGGFLMFYPYLLIYHNSK